MELICFNGWGFNQQLLQHFVTQLKGFEKVYIIDAHENIHHEILSSAKEKIILCWSLGGTRFLENHLSFNHVKGIIFMNSTPCFINHPSYEIGWHQEIIDEMCHALTIDTTYVLNNFLRKCLGKQLNHHDHIKSNLMNDHKLLVNTLRDLTEINAIEVLKDIDVPCLIIAGRKDRLISYKNSLFMQSKLQRSQLEVIDSAGHMLFIEKEQQLIQIIDNFLRSFHDQQR